MDIYYHAPVALSQERVARSELKAFKTKLNKDVTHDEV